FGALETNVRNVDFAAADAHKWLLGPLGIAVLYVRKEHLERLRPPLVGAHSAPTTDFQVHDRLSFWPDARRYEPGSFNIVGIVGLHAALKLILGVGIRRMEEQVLALARCATDAGRRRGLGVVGSVTEQGLSGIISFEPNGDATDCHRRLAQAGIMASL